VVIRGKENYVHDDPDISNVWGARPREESVLGACLLCGQRKSIAQLHPAIKNVYGAPVTGATWSSFNKQCAESYGKEQNYNAPICEEHTHAYTTALNYLLANEKQRVVFGNATVVFWSETPNPLEASMGEIINPKKDSPAIDEALRQFLLAARNAEPVPEMSFGDSKFYMLGLVPTGRARLAARVWEESTIKEVASRIGKYFSEIAMEPEFEDQPVMPSVWYLLKSISRDEIEPEVMGAFVKAILTGQPYPRIVYELTLQRIKAERSINYPRAALLKAFLLRNEKKEASMSLDILNKNIGYRLGRLFAILEKLQDAAIPKPKTGIGTRFYGAASTTPGTVFPELVHLAQHHTHKLAYGKWYSQKIQEVTEGITEFPMQLELPDQGQFALGYYHQKRELYTKKTKEQA
jgi:CRISPR-associated protein Csd1